jgi:hypothetical protein
MFRAKFQASMNIFSTFDKTKTTSSHHQQWDLGGTTIVSHLLCQADLDMVETEDETNMIINDHVVDTTKKADIHRSTATDGTTTRSNHSSTEQDLERCIQLLQEHSIRLVVFDMDQTAVSAHSRGRLERTELATFLDHATPDFLSLVPLLHKHEIGIAIATHSDVAEYGKKDELVQPATHILGEELARALVDRHFLSDIANAFFIVAYNPRWRGLEGELEHNRIKRHHMRMLQTHFEQVQVGAGTPADTLFFDDTPHVVDDCRDTCGVRAVLVDPKVGFQLSDLINHLSA